MMDGRLTGIVLASSSLEFDTPLPGARSIRLDPYRCGPRMRWGEYKKVQKMLNVQVFEAVQTALVSSVVFVPKN